MKLRQYGVPVIGTPNRSYKHINQMLLNQELYGSQYRYISNIPESQIIDSISKKRILIMSQTMAQLENAYRCKDYIKLSKQLDEFKRMVIDAKMGPLFIELNGYSTLRLILLDHYVIQEKSLTVPPKPQSNRPLPPIPTISYPKLTSIYIGIINILTEISNNSGDYITKLIVNDTEVINKLFLLIEDHRTIDHFAILLHTILPMIDLKKINGLYRILSNLSSTKFYMMVKILVPAIFQPDYNDAPNLSESIELRSKITDLYAINQSILLNAPQFIEKIIKLLNSSLRSTFVSPSLRRTTFGESNENDWDQLDEYKPPVFLSEMDVRIVLGDLNVRNDMDNPQQYLLEYSRSAYQSDLIITLYCLASAYRKIDILQYLLKLGFANTLESLLKSMDWTVSDYATEINPFYVRKIHTIRMLILYFDIDTLIVLKSSPLISRHEKHIIERGEEYKCTDETCQKEGNSLLLTLFKCFKQCKNHEKERNLLTSSLQAALKSSNVDFHSFLIKHGILDILVGDIISRQSDGASFLQMNFDLLGEVVKFHRSIFIALDNIFRTDNQAFTTFCEIVINNLIESNVFLRAILLSVYQFKLQDNLNQNNNNNNNTYDFQNSLLYQFVKENTFKIMRITINKITPQNLQLDNLCCLNTYLLFLIVAKKENMLTHHINELKHLDKMHNDQQTQRTLELFDIWKQFYALNTNDVLSLEQGSRMKFIDFLDVQKSLRSLLLEEEEEDQL